MPKGLDSKFVDNCKKSLWEKKVAVVRHFSLFQEIIAVVEARVQIDSIIAS